MFFFFEKEETNVKKGKVEGNVRVMLNIHALEDYIRPVKFHHSHRYIKSTIVNFIFLPELRWKN